MKEKKSMLMLAPVNPFRCDSGARIRIFQTLKVFSSELNEDFDVTFLFLDDLVSGQVDIAQYQSELNLKSIIRIKHRRSKVSSYIKSIIFGHSYRAAKFNNEVVGRLLINQSVKFDLIYCHFFDMALNLPSKSKILKAAGRLVVDTHNDDYHWYMSFIKSRSMLKKLYGKFSASRFRKEFFSLCDYVDDVVCVSQSDMHSMQEKLAGNSKPPPNFYSLPNGLEIFEGVADRGLNYSCLFCGSLSVEMNVDAVLWFVRSCVAELRNIFPQFELVLVGRSPVNSILKLEGIAGVSVFGDVESVSFYYQKANVSIMPFKHGGGSKLKLLEAFTYGLPVVCSREGVVGNHELSEFLTISDLDPQEFIKSIVSCFKNYDEAKEKALKGKAYVDSVFSWGQINKDFINQYVEVNFY